MIAANFLLWLVESLVMIGGVCAVGKWGDHGPTSWASVGAWVVFWIAFDIASGIRAFRKIELR